MTDLHPLVHFNTRYSGNALQILGSSLHTQFDFKAKFLCLSVFYLSWLESKMLTPRIQRADLTMFLSSLRLLDYAPQQQCQVEGSASQGHICKPACFLKS